MFLSRKGNKKALPATGCGKDILKHVNGWERFRVLSYRGVGIEILLGPPHVSVHELKVMG